MITKMLTGAGALLLALIAGLWFFFGRDDTPTGEFTIQTAEAETTDIRRSVSASGSVRARVTVEVGSQLSGQLAEIMVDYNSPVEAGQVIARIDPQTFETRVRESEAAVATAEAQVELQRASLQRVDANLAVAQEEFARIESLHARGIASDAAFQTATAQLESARSERAVALAQITNARAALQQREATLEGARIDLERTVIRAPIDGVVIDRVVDVGQTVAASMSAPTLFTIAQDLSVVQIDAQVDESDIGQITQGQPASFSVDAFPGRTYEGRVEQVRLAATNTANVVTYTVVITADNPGGRLLPGMTANLDIITGEREGVLSVPNGALRFRPSGPLEDRVIAAAEPAGAPQGQRGGRRGGPGGGGPGGMMARMAEELEMTEDQQRDAQEAMRQVFSQMRAQAESGTPPDRSAMGARIAEALSGVLTPEQMARYRQMQAAASESQSATIYVQNADGMFEERNIRIGVADNQRTEVLGGQLEAGEAVVTRARPVE
ncbi:efflux RND transporter periplasmic adaptor subunit [Hyphobacterium marinum]|uniref:Efflux RND transporter periplasmic adaptor subunit n=1 Tax=Hyphobacterium marinum TaxID=3116574 RepID=A0ABU7LYX7_9PROT|nr:efflux RND transporter periplasmic adaptor subunit [Hyphobacterium sp. Y6023]MEE2566758.1 efflux RND transporter periplasmic adaptor subunit [Hyphobacterium sp. Y6023]